MAVVLVAGGTGTGPSSPPFVGGGMLPLLCETGGYVYGSRVEGGLQALCDVLCIFIFLILGKMRVKSRGKSWDGGKAVGVMAIRVRRMDGGSESDRLGDRTISALRRGVGGCHEAERPSAGTVAFRVRFLCGL